MRDSILAEHEKIHRALGVELWRSELALRESEAQAWALLNAPTDSALLIEPHGIILALNEAAAKALGRSPNELIGLCVFDLFPPDVAKRRKAHCDQVVRSGQPVRFGDQREGRWLDSSLYPVLDAQGRVVQIAVLAHDITEHKRVENALRESEAQAWALLNAPPDSVLLLDPDGTIVSRQGEAPPLGAGSGPGGAGGRERPRPRVG
jgi:PAS domain S-box-containing protein